jgi:hypothetical protein
MDCGDEEGAREAPRKRERIPSKNRDHIAAWSEGETDPGGIPGLADWAGSVGASSVVWTALPPKFDGQDRVPNEQEVVDYLRACEDRAGTGGCLCELPRRSLRAFRGTAVARLGSWAADIAQ